MSETRMDLHDLAACIMKQDETDVDGELKTTSNVYARDESDPDKMIYQWSEPVDFIDDGPEKERANR